MENENKKTIPLMKRAIQDSVFTNLFRDKKYQIQLYRALHPEDTGISEDDIVTVTVQNVLTDNTYNDLGILIGDTLLILVEAQSTWSENIIMRALMYLMQTYNEYFKSQGVNLYSSKKIKIPKPELYVIFTGERSKKPEYISLSEEFFSGQEFSIDVKVKIIYDSEEGDIVNQYIVFTRVCKEQIKRYGRSREAISEAIRICKNKNVLKEYLESREKEVVNIMMTLYDEQEIMERYVKSEVAEAEKEASLRSVIETCQDLGVSMADTVTRIALKFKLTQSEAEESVREYWK